MPRVILSPSLMGEARAIADRLTNTLRGVTPELEFVISIPFANVNFLTSLWFWVSSDTWKPESVYAVIMSSPSGFL